MSYVLTGLFHSGGRAWSSFVAFFALVSLTLAGGDPSMARAEVNPPPLNAITSGPPDPPLITAEEVVVDPPANLSDFVQDETALLKLGKALFWDMQLGSDGIQACASCHFHAGADSRSKNQITPGLLATPKDITFSEQLGGLIINF